MEDIEGNRNKHSTRSCWFHAWLEEGTMDYDDYMEGNRRKMSIECQEKISHKKWKKYSRNIKQHTGRRIKR
jgi:hypothetical protein